MIPNDWLLVKMGSVCQFERGITFPATAKEEKSSQKNIPCLRTTNVQEKLIIDDLIYVDKIYMKNNPAKLVRINDIIMSSANSRELVGKTCYVDNLPFPMTFGGFVLNIRAKGILSKYLFYFLRHEFLIGKFMEESSQTVNIANINTSKLLNHLIPLPSVNEQQRIVDIIENLFTKLDRAKALAQNVIDNYELRRSAILHKAFTGKLTSSDINSWQQKKLYEIGLLERGRSKHRPRNDPILFGGKFPFIQTGDVANAKDYIVSHKQTLSDVGLQQSRMFSSGTLCITIAANIGDVAILTYDCCFPDSIVGFTPKENINVKYVYYKLKTIQKILQASAPATAQKNINLKVLSEIKIILPSFEEQKEIVCILDSLLAKEQRTKELAEQILQKIDLMKKSILARAFRGELGRND